VYRIGRCVAFHSDVYKEKGVYRLGRCGAFLRCLQGERCVSVRKVCSIAQMFTRRKVCIG
jgi:hypothetical protein